jgi:hypothetical protein
VKPEHPLNLAFCRVAVLLVILVSPEVQDGVAWSSLPPALRVVPEGLGWLVALVPITPDLARIAQVVLVASAMTGIAGLFSRISLLIVTFAGLYLFAMVQLSGSVTHDMHLFWFTALLAASPSGAALSLDAWIARRRRPSAPAPGPSVACAVPLWGARLLLGAIYFFPGFWKLWSSGLGWIFSDNLRNQMYWKWYQMGGFTPALRVDLSPTSCQAGALAAVLFELSFVLLVLTRRGRVAAAIVGLGFHLVSSVFLRIPFMSLWICYVVLIDWAAISARIERLGGAEPEPPENGVSRRENGVPRRAVVCACLGLALLAGAVVQGGRNAVQAWPFACYPTFQWMVSAEIPDLLVEAVGDDGRPAALLDGGGGAAGGARSQQRWGMVWSITGMYGRDPTEAQLRAYLDLLAVEAPVRDAMEGAAAARFYRAFYSVIPEDRGKPPLRKEMIGEVSLR